MGDSRHRVTVVLPPAETFEQAAIVVRQLQEGVALRPDQVARAWAILTLAEGFAQHYLAEMKATAQAHGVATDETQTFHGTELPRER